VRVHGKCLIGWSTPRLTPDTLIPRLTSRSHHREEEFVESPTHVDQNRFLLGGSTVAGDHPGRGAGECSCIETKEAAD
jgi:hypothetical protein